MAKPDDEEIGVDVDRVTQILRNTVVEHANGREIEVLAKIIHDRDLGNVVRSLAVEIDRLERAAAARLSDYRDN